MKRYIRILPSILSADFACLGNQIKIVEEAGAEVLHIDVMDGHYVPNITLGPVVVESLRKITNIQLDVHLMILNADHYVESFVKAGANLISVHIEAVPHIHRTLEFIRSFGVSPGIAINPGTSLHLLEEILPCVDFVLLMTVNPGFGGQKFISTCLSKIQKLKSIITERQLNIKIEVDGGVKLDNVSEIAQCGADWLVAGSAIFDSSDPAQAFKELHYAASAL